MSPDSSTLPRLGSVEDFGNHMGLKKHQAYAHLKNLPEDCIFRMGARIWINMDNLAAHIKRGKAV